MLRRMKSRMSFSMDETTTDYINRQAAQFGGNASAWLERLVIKDALRDSVARYARWQQDHPTYDENSAEEHELAVREAGLA